MITTINEFRKINEAVDNTEKAKQVMAVATPEQKIVLDDFQSGTEYFFFNLLNGEITAETIDRALQLMYNSVEGDLTQLEPEHAKYVEMKGWTKEFNSLYESLENPQIKSINVSSTKQIIKEIDLPTKEVATGEQILFEIEKLSMGAISIKDHDKNQITISDFSVDYVIDALNKFQKKPKLIKFIESKVNETFDWQDHENTDLNEPSWEMRCEDLVNEFMTALNKELPIGTAPAHERKEAINEFARLFSHQIQEAKMKI